jgi:hypothetical protein
MAVKWWVVVPPANVNDGANAQVIQVQVGSAEESALYALADITVQGQTVTRYMGPFATEAAARAAHPPSGLAWIGTLVGAVAGAGGAAASGNGAQVPQAAAGGAAAGQAAGSAVTGWTHNIEQWLVRGFEMLLGAALIIVGLAKLASGTPAGKAALKIGKAAAVL